MLTMLDLVNELEVGQVIKHLKALNENPNHKAFVAGGWLRDVLNGVTPKDIDIFVVGENLTLDNVKSLNPTQFSMVRTMHNSGNSNFRDDVIGVNQFPEHGVDVICMRVNTVEQVVENFDVSICQIAGVLNGDHIDVYATDDYLDWGRKHVIYQYTDIPTTDNHLDRVRAKYNVELTEATSKPVSLIKIGELHG